MFQQFGFGNIHRRQVRNKDVTLTYTLEFKDIFTGRALSLSYNLPSGKKKYIDITVPAGVKNGDVVNFQGYGDDSIPNLKPGNLHLKLRVPNHPKWKRDEDNITCIEKVDIFELMLGTNITIETPTGKEIALSIQRQKQKIYSHFSTLEKAFRKYKRQSLNETLIDKYLENSTNALLEDKNYSELERIFEISQNKLETVSTFELNFGPENENDIIRQYDLFLKTIADG